MRKNLIPTGYYGPFGLDRQHYIDPDVIFEDGAELHIFRNPGGYKYAAIYRNGEEVYSQSIDRCNDMIKYYKKYEVKRNLNHEVSGK